MKQVAIDFETYYDDETSATTQGQVKYALSLPPGGVLLVALHNDEFEFIGDPSEFEWELLDGYEFIAHNAGFDQSIAEAWGYVKEGATWYDTADLCAYHGIPRSLKNAVKIQYGEQLDKGVRSKAKGKARKDFTRKEWDEFVKYGLDDARWCWYLWEDLKDAWPFEEREISRLTREMGRAGVPVNVEYITDAITSLSHELNNVENSIPWVGKPTGKKKKGVPEVMGVASKTGLKQECIKSRIPVPKSTAKDSPIWEAWVEKYKDKAPWCEVLNTHGSLNRQLNVYKSAYNRTIFEEGVMPYEKLYYGGHTGRWSGSGGLNMENLDRDPKFGFHLRNIFIAPNDYYMIRSDYSQVEPRFTFYRAGNDELLGLIRETGISIYEAFAKVVLGFRGNNLKKTNPNLYRLAKAMVLGGGYGAGGPAFQAAAKSLAGLDLSPKDAANAVATYRKNNPKVVMYWQECERKCAMAARELGYYETNQPVFWNRELISGRCLRYRDLRKSGMGWVAKLPSVKGVDGLRDTKIWGGILTENEMQALSRDILRDALLKMEKHDYLIPAFTVHDELVSFCPMDIPEEEGVREQERIMLDVPEWAREIPFALETEVSQHYE